MDKPFLNFDQQVDKLINEYGLIINDRDNAKEILFSLSYYDLVNGYKFIFMQDDKRYHPGTTIDHLMRFHIYNKNIQSLIFKYSTYVENSFKNNLAHVIAENISDNHTEYLKLEHYGRIRNSEERSNFSKALRAMIKATKDCPYTPTKHYRLHKNHIPPWILLRNTTFSDSATLFMALKREHKEKFLEGVILLNNKKIDYGVKVSLTVSALRCVRKFRNQIAHNLNFISYNSTPLDLQINRIYLGTLVTDKEIKKSFGNVWACVISIALLLNQSDLSKVFLAELMGFLNVEPELSQFYCRYSGIPFDYSTRIKKYLGID